MGKKGLVVMEDAGVSTSDASVSGSGIQSPDDERMMRPVPDG